MLGDLTYSYDATGNRLATGGNWARTGIPGSIPNSSYDAANEQLAFGNVTQTFDANGNLLTQTDPSGTTMYSWDARNRLVAINGPSINASFSYDALGRRISKSINGQTTTFHYDGLDIVRESGGPGDVSYLRSLEIDEALVRSDESGVVTYLADILGSTVALADSTGAPVTSYTYAPFGETFIAGLPSANPFQFTARENDGIGLYLFRARFYDSRAGRFLEEDPSGFEAAGMDLYVYVGNAPLTRVDPFGLDFRPPPRQYGGPWRSPGAPHLHPISEMPDETAAVTVNDLGLWPWTRHDVHPREGERCLKCNETTLQRCLAKPPTPPTVASCVSCVQSPIPRHLNPACWFCTVPTTLDKARCVQQSCTLGTRDSCGRCQ